MEMITLLNVFVVGWLVPLVQCQTGQLSPPTDVSLTWVTEFCYKLSWTPPVVNETCKYNLVGGNRVSNTWKYKYDTMEGGLLKLELSAICGGRESMTLHPSFANPELVSDFKCALHSKNSQNCTWLPAKHVADFHLYYWLRNLSEHSPINNCARTFDLVECPVYQSNANGTKTGCALQGDFIGHYIYFLINGTIDGTLARNTFGMFPSHNMRPALNWTVEADSGNDKLIISWTPVTLGGKWAWEYILNYTECGKRKTPETISSGINNTKVLALGHCEFVISLKATNIDGHGESLPGLSKKYGKNTNPYTPLILACILIPAALVVALVVALVCYRRHNESIFPQVPAPQDFLPDMLKNSNGLTPKALYVPQQEEEPQNVSFLIER